MMPLRFGAGLLRRAGFAFFLTAALRFLRAGADFCFFFFGEDFLRALFAIGLPPVMRSGISLSGRALAHQRHERTPFRVAG